MKKKIFNTLILFICKDFNLTENELFSTSREYNIVFARQVLFYTSFKNGVVISEIMRFMAENGRDLKYPAIKNGIEKIEKKISIDPDLKKFIEYLERNTKSNWDDISFETYDLN